MKARHAVVLGLSAMFSSVAVAGYVQPFNVEVLLNPDGSGSAMGDMASARFADNDAELIGCGIRVVDTGVGDTFRFGFCQATSAAGVRAMCQTQRPDLVDAMKATADYSFITFGWNADGECTRVGYSTQSFYLPQSRDKK